MLKTGRASTALAIAAAILVPLAPAAQAKCHVGKQVKQRAIYNFAQDPAANAAAAASSQKDSAFGE